MFMKDSIWRFLDTGKGSALFNMALDEVLLDEVKKGESPPIVRLYEWFPAAITFGYSQKNPEKINVNRCVDDKVDVTRRLTGGRAVFHDDEVTCSIIGSVRDPEFGGTLLETYRSVSMVLLKAFDRLGVHAELNRGMPINVEKTADKHFFSCFLSTSRYEITVDGKKLVGIAQRRFRNFFLQQCSILVGPGYERIADYMNDKKAAEEYARLISEKTIDLTSILNHNVDRGEVKKTLRESFSDVVGMNLIDSSPEDKEIIYAQRLMDERYGSKGWVMENES